MAGATLPNSSDHRKPPPSSSDHRKPPPSSSDHRKPPPSSSDHRKPPPSSSDHRKSRWDHNSNPATKSPPNPKPSPSTATAAATAVTAATNPNPNSNPKSLPTIPSPTSKTITITNTKASTSTKTAPSPSQSLKPGQPNQISQSGHTKAPIPPGTPFAFADPSQLGPLPPPSYGFHMLDRRTIVLADGSVRSYFALPPDYQDFAPPIRAPVMDVGSRFMPFGPGGVPMSPDGFRGEQSQIHGRGRHNGSTSNSNNQDYWNSLGLEGRGGGVTPNEGILKRKYGDGERHRRDDRDGFGRDEFARHRQQLLQYGNVGPNPGDRGEFMAGTSSPFGRGGVEMRAAKSMKLGEGGSKLKDIDQKALKAAFLQFVKVINENTNQKMSYLADGKQEPIKCVACGRSSKDFPDMHSLIMHTYHSDNADLLVDHLGLHKALCVLMGWDYTTPPDNSKAYQLLSPDQALANQGDLIMWPPLVIIHNTSTGKSRDGRMEGLGNKSMDAKLRDLGCRGGKSKAVYGREGHLGITLVKFASDQSGLKEAFQLAEFFDKENLGRRSWARVQSMTSGKDDDNNPNLVKFDERTREKQRIFYGYLGTAADLDKVDFETKKKISVESLREYMMSKLPT